MTWSAWHTWDFISFHQQLARKSSGDAQESFTTCSDSLSAWVSHRATHLTFHTSKRRRYFISTTRGYSRRSMVSMLLNSVIDYVFLVNCGFSWELTTDPFTDSFESGKLRRVSALSQDRRELASQASTLVRGSSRCLLDCRLLSRRSLISQLGSLSRPNTTLVKTPRSPSGVGRNGAEEAGIGTAFCTTHQPRRTDGPPRSPFVRLLCQDPDQNCSH